MNKILTYVKTFIFNNKLKINVFQKSIIFQTEYFYYTYILLYVNIYVNISLTKYIKRKIMQQDIFKKLLNFNIYQ